MSDPEQPTGAKDPGEPVDPEDPLSLKPEPDPLATPADPDSQPTKTGGVEIPPPPPPDPPQPPPGRPELKAAFEKYPDLPNLKVNPKLGSSDASRVRCWRVAQQGRYSLSEHWATLKRVALGMADVYAAGAADPTTEQAKLAKLRQHLASDTELNKALDDWCAARDETPVDLKKLADAANRVKSTIDVLQALLTVDGMIGKGTVDAQRAILGEALGGFIAEVTSEGRQVLAGRRINRGTSSDVPIFHLTKLTRDGTFDTRLGNSSTWAETLGLVKTEIGDNALGTPVSKDVGKVKLEELSPRLASLDDALEARDKAPDDYQARAEVLAGYSRVGDKLSDWLEKVRKRQAALSGKQKPPPGEWGPTEVRKGGDALAGLARALQAELAADPLLQDPDLASAARSLLTRIGPLASASSLDALAAQAGMDLSKVWSDAKNKEVQALKAVGSDLGNLPNLFSAKDSNLEPLLDQWSAEIAKFPKQTRATLKDLAAKIAEQIQRYRTAINKQLSDQRSSRLTEGLDILATALARQIRSYDSRGGLFG